MVCGNGKQTQEVELGNIRRDVKKKKTKGAALTVAVLQYFGTAVVLYLSTSPTLSQRSEQLVFMAVDNCGRAAGRLFSTFS